MSSIIIVGLLQLLQHLVRSYHIICVSGRNKRKVFIATAVYQILSLSSYSLGISAFLKGDWYAVASFVIFGSVGAVLGTVSKKEETV